MNPSSTSRGLLLLSLVCGSLGLLCAYLLVHNLRLEVQIAFARDQADFFEEMRARASHSDTTEAAELLAAVMHYYESGSKQEKGSPLDHVVELARQSAARAIIVALRAKSGQDLGDDPQAWIDKLLPR